MKYNYTLREKCSGTIGAVGDEVLLLWLQRPVGERQDPK